ncbi:MAG: M20/M25/M40 family metallo-hydrolase [Candidatus Cloacimonadota bacterium]|nr:M20/M25/M40 family metallo-hydrolase [Candidatus Cloacimonadota bacterium]
MDRRLVDYFVSLVKIDSESQNEAEIAMFLKNDLEEMGAKVIIDNAGKNVNSNVGNLIAKFPGKIGKEPLSLFAHMDTVKPGKNVKPIIKDGVLYSDGSTILGADDKSGIVMIVEAIRRLQIEKFDYAPLEVVFTICEEIGLLGAKHLDYFHLNSKIGYALDGGEIGSIIVNAPALNTWQVTIYGKEAHAGGSPEKGINAIQVASEAISKIHQGRIDAETTANIGIISGGQAHNVIPGEVIVEGEVRSHDPKKLEKITNEIIAVFQKVAEKYSVKLNETVVRASIKEEIQNDFPFLKIDSNGKAIKISKDAAVAIGLESQITSSGGGSDANVLFGNGICAPILGTGMHSVHSKDEFIKIEDLEKGTEWITEIIKQFSK